ncbi:polyprenyl synthetase family protein [Streptomyces sp. NPDC101116]|uniref:polyprenyl synthetase family protein n=1 Tax=Streptomyces sp. NPDC101116 TaxID=3366107 RepID=UPI00381B712A
MREVIGQYVMRGGKRLRSLLCVVGWYAGGGNYLARSVVNVAASLEMFHACALLLDDVMDESHVRRGQPTAHRALAGLRDGDQARRFGANAAILLGNLALSWSDELLRSADLTPRQLRQVGAEIDSMRRATVYGQYQDLLAAFTRTPQVDKALFIARNKTARYTVDAPLRAGAVIAGADDESLSRLSDFALPLGIGYQIRDDILGVFGDPAETGKPRGDDLRDGKCTLLAALGVSRADSPDARRLTHLLSGPLGPDEEAEARNLLVTTGAREAAEMQAAALQQQALDALTGAPFPPEILDILRRLADELTLRTK